MYKLEEPENNKVIEIDYTVRARSAPPHSLGANKLGSNREVARSQIPQVNVLIEPNKLAALERLA